MMMMMIDDCRLHSENKRCLSPPAIAHVHIELLEACSFNRMITAVLSDHADFTSIQ